MVVVLGVGKLQQGVGNLQQVVDNLQQWVGLVVALVADNLKKICIMHAASNVCIVCV